MDNNCKDCDTCFYQTADVRGKGVPCIECVPGVGSSNKWVAIDFLKNVPDDEASIEGEGVMSQMAEQLLRSSAADSARKASNHASSAAASASDAFASVCRVQEGLYSKPQEPESALDKQVSGGHYKALKIQPIEFLHANNIPFAEGCAIKYLCRWRDKGGIKDLEKAKHFIELLIELEERVQ
jgi:hypothetical protein